MESGETEKAIQELIQMIKFNYTQVEQDFQSIYNLHELLLSLAVPLCLKEGTNQISLNFEELEGMLSDDASEDLFPDFTPDKAFLVKLNASFNHYAHQYIGDKSVNALNCRKSAFLSMMLLRHKMVVLSDLTLNRQQEDSLFSALIKEYTEVFMSV